MPLPIEVKKSEELDENSPQAQRILKAVKRLESGRLLLPLAYRTYLRPRREGSRCLRGRRSPRRSRPPGGLRRHSLDGQRRHLLDHRQGSPVHDEPEDIEPVAVPRHVMVHLLRDDGPRIENRSSSGRR